MLLWVRCSGIHEVLLRYAARDDHNRTTTITMIAQSCVCGRGAVDFGRWPVAVSGGPVSGGP